MKVAIIGGRDHDSLMSTAYLSFYLEWMYANATPKIIRTITDAGLPCEHIEQVLPDAKQHNHIYVINTQVEISLIKSCMEMNIPMTIVSSTRFDDKWLEQYDQQVKTHAKKTSYNSRVYVVQPTERAAPSDPGYAYISLNELTESFPIDACECAGMCLVYELTYPDVAIDDSEEAQSARATREFFSQEGVKTALATALDKSDVMALKQIIIDYTWWFCQAEKKFVYTEDT